MLSVLGIQYLEPVCADERVKLQSCGGDSSDAVLEFSEFCHQMNKLTINEVSAYLC